MTYPQSYYFVSLDPTHLLLSQVLTLIHYFVIGGVR